jgi:3-phosphoshikimate 1-carboxyvinyltransferase
MNQEVLPNNYSGNIFISSSKSDGQRALILALLSSKKTEIHNLGKSKDELAVFKAIQDLGAKCEQISKNTIQIEGISELENDVEINLGESGLGFRILCSVCSLFNKNVILKAEGSLKSRPMHFFEEVLPKFGVKVTSNNGLAPIKICGPISGNELEIDASLSSQFLSGLLITLAFSKSNSRLHVKNLNSVPYLEMTLNSLKKFGIEIENNSFENFKISGNQKANAVKYFVEGDWSSASFWLVASALGQDISVSNLDLTSLQADKIILEILKNANCGVLMNKEQISISGEERKNFHVDLTHSPDLFPILAIYAALTPGKNTLVGTKRLIHKESNRALSLKTELNKLNIDVKLTENEMIIHGQNKINGGIIDSHNDHRIAMAFGVLGMFTENKIVINQAECVQKSYPDFWLDLEKLRK